MATYGQHPEFRPWQPDREPDPEAHARLAGRSIASQLELRLRQHWPNGPWPTFRQDVEHLRALAHASIDAHLDYTVAEALDGMWGLPGPRLTVIRGGRP